MRRWLPVFFVLMSCKFRQEVSLIVHHGMIYTADTAFTVVEAMAVRDGKIIETGTNETILRKYSATEMLNAEGKTIVPGLIDAHCHFTGYATDMWKCDVTGTRSFDEVVARLSAYAAKAPAEWLYGRGWDQNDWPVKQFPDKQQLDQLFPNRPVFLKRIDGHAALVNSAALQRAGINAQTTIDGGAVILQNGQPTGMLIDNAMDLVERVIPAVADSLALQYYLRAQDSCFRYGLTGVHDCGVSEHTIDLVQQSYQSGKLHLKLYALLSDSAQYIKKWAEKGPLKSGKLHVGGFKVYADGALGSRGACLLQDYSDKTGWKGFLLTDRMRFRSMLETLAASKLQVCTHAIGDSGNRMVLQEYGRLLKPGNDRRWRIEHAQVVHPDDRKLFEHYQIVPSVQPTHATSDMYWAEERLGNTRLHNAYSYQSLLRQLGWMPLGTDFPVEGMDPLRTFYAAVVRKDGQGWPADGFLPEEALTRREALWGMTHWAAMAAFEEQEKGSLEAGKSADFVILNRDLIQVPASELLQIRVIQTYIDGIRRF